MPLFDVDDNTPRRGLIVDDLQLKYANRAGDTRSIDLAQVETMTVVRADRWEFALHTRSGREYVFRAGSKEAYAAWWEGLQQYHAMARAYYAS